MNAKKIILIISAVFYIIILGLSFSAKVIHTASLPRVKVIQLDFEKFDIVETEVVQSEDEDGISNDINTQIEAVAAIRQTETTGVISNVGDIQQEDMTSIDNVAYDNEADLINKKYDFQLSIPMNIYDNKRVYILSTKIINGEERNIAKEVTNLELGRTNECCYEVLQGISFFDQVIIEGQDILQDGCEVYVEE